MHTKLQENCISVAMTRKGIAQIIPNRSNSITNGSAPSLLNKDFTSDEYLTSEKPPKELNKPIQIQNDEEIKQRSNYIKTVK